MPIQLKKEFPKKLTIIRNDSTFTCQYPECESPIKAKRKYCDEHRNYGSVIGGRNSTSKRVLKARELNQIPKERKKLSRVLIFSEDLPRLNQFKPFNLSLKKHKETIHKLITYAENEGKLTPKSTIRKEVSRINIYLEDVERLDHFKNISGLKNRKELIFELLNFVEKNWNPTPKTEREIKHLSIYSEDIPRLRNLKQINGYKSNKELIHELLGLIKPYQFYTLLE